MKRLSVLMPIYNEKPTFLCSAIESILNQTYKDYEFIIIDDASDKYVHEIVQSYNDERILYCKQDSNQKICAALNRGMDLACGEYIAIMHSDDVAIKTRLELEVDVLDKYSDVGLVNSYSVVNTNGRYYINMPSLKDDELKLYLKYIENVIVHPNVMFRKNILKFNNIKYNEKFVFAEDYRLWNDIMQFCKFYTIPEILTIYNRNVNPSRQNYKYMNTCKKVILLENYRKILNLDANIVESLINKLWNYEFKYKDYIYLKNNVYEPLVSKIKEKVSNKLFCSFKHDLMLAIEDFNPYNKG